MKRILLIIPLGLTFILAFAQSLPLPPPGLKYQLNYVVEEVNYYKMAVGTPITSLSPLDMVELREHRTLKQVEMRIEEDGNHATSIIILNPEEAYSEWPTKVGRIEISAAGTRIYQTNGSLYVDLPADAAAQARYAALKENLADRSPQVMYNFPLPPNEAAANQIQANGGEVNMLSQGAWKISGNGIELLYEPAFSWITRATYQGDQIAEKDIRQYAPNDQGVLVPQIETTETTVVRPSGACMQQVIRKKYREYHLAVARSERSLYSQNMVDQASLLLPNPGTEAVTLRLGPTVRPGSRLQVTDLFGRVVYEQGSVHPSAEQNLSVTGWPPGVYLFRLETGAGSQVLKFIKAAQ